jgi:hypothetical protein
MGGRYVYYTLTPASSIAARAILRWSRDYAAEVSKCGRASIVRFECSLTDPRKSLMAGNLQKAYEAAGITFAEDGCGLSWPREFLREDEERRAR